MNAPRFRHVSARTRVNLCALVGFLAGGVVGFFGPWQLAVLAGWNVMALLFLAWVWLEISPCNAMHTRERSTIEDSSRGAAVVVVTSASVLSLAGMAFGLTKAHHADRLLAVALTVMAVLAVMLAWSVVHTMFTLRYAHLYYSDPVGGIDFNTDDVMPDYHDFAYLSFTVGMAFAVSDTEIASQSIRRSLTRHAIISYLFGAVVVGVTINVMAGFVR